MNWTLRDLFRYGKGIIVKRYNTGERITVTAEITANHKGYFEFRLCPQVASTRTMSPFFLTIEQPQITSFTSLPGQIPPEHGQRQGHEIFYRLWNRRVFHLDPTSSGA